MTRRPFPPLESAPNPSAPSKATSCPRAEPIAGLFECGKARLAGRFPELEDELGGLVAAGGYEGPQADGRGSPDRADAMVWALWALLLAGKAEPRVRAL